MSKLFLKKETVQFEKPKEIVWNQYAHDEG